MTDFRDDPPPPRLQGSRRDALSHFGLEAFPRWALVRQEFGDKGIPDVSVAVRDALNLVSDRLLPGQVVCLAVGSRGIDQIVDVVREAVAVLRRINLSVFVVPAMGSHGGATPDGQTDVLASLGITPTSIGCEIRSSMATDYLGTVDGDIPVYVDRHALRDADAIVPINRVKPHTDFTGRVESGLAKMIAIGLGNQEGADTFHAQGFQSFDRLIPLVAAHTLARVSIPFGLALLEDGNGRLRRIEAVPSELILEREPALLEEADTFLARLPAAQIDVLILDRIGKDISGLGMDSNVVGRYYTGPTPTGPSIQRIIVRDLTDETDGNAVGIGMADIVLRRVVDRMDATKTYVNCITAKTPEGARIALTAESDRQALEFALACCIGVDPATSRIVRVRDTKHLEWMFASEALLPELALRPDCDVVGVSAPIDFDRDAGFSQTLPS